jgi:hypothetical protein
VSGQVLIGRRYLLTIDSYLRKTRGTKLNKIGILFLPALLVLPVGCQHTADLATLQKPGQLADGWETASLGEVGIAPQKFAGLEQEIEDGGYKNLHSILLVKDGKLVLEAYFNDYSSYTRQDVASVTKSVTSALIGIAIAQGFVESVDQPLASLLAEYADLIHSDPAKGNLTLRRTFLTELITTSFVLAGLLPVILLLQVRWFPLANFELSSPFFWLLITLAAAAGVLTIYPFNQLPSLRSAWWALLASITVLVAALGLAITNMA